MAEKFRFYAIWLSLICVLTFILQIFIKGFTDFFILDENSSVQYWRFLSAIFLHSGVIHLFYNLFALVLFGSILEKIIGGKRFLSVFFFSGLIANIFASYFYPSSLGASGAIFGVLGALVILRPKMMVFAFGLPMPMALAGIIWMIGDIIGLFVPDDVGHYAHLFGMFIGFIFGLFYLRRFREIQQERKREVVFDEESVRKWEDYFLK